MDHVNELFEGVFQTGRFPVGIYPGWLRFSVTFLVPIAFAVTVPAEAVTSRARLADARARGRVRGRPLCRSPAGSGATASQLHGRLGMTARRADLALRSRRALVGRVQPRRTGDRLLPAVRRSRAAGARRRVRHGSAARAVPACGLDVDGCDISPDMLALASERAVREGLDPPNLYAQAMHELDLPRRYRTIIVCGGFGLGGSASTTSRVCGGSVRASRAGRHARPRQRGSVRAAIGSGATRRRTSGRSCRSEYRDEGDRRATSDGAELELRSRVLDVDPLAQRVVDRDPRRIVERTPSSWPRRSTPSR